MRWSTPFFKAFGSLLFGSPGSKVKEVKAVESLGEVYDVFGDFGSRKDSGAGATGGQQPGAEMRANALIEAGMKTFRMELEEIRALPKGDKRKGLLAAFRMKPL